MQDIARADRFGLEDAMQEFVAAGRLDDRPDLAGIGPFAQEDTRGDRRRIARGDARLCASIALSATPAAWRRTSISACDFTQRRLSLRPGIGTRCACGRSAVRRMNVSAFML